MRSRVPVLSYGNVVATLALFVALGGVSYAAATLPRNSVGSRQLKKNAVTNSKIKRSAVSSSKIKNHTITGSDIKNGTITGGKINIASLGTVPSAAGAETATHWNGALDPTLRHVAPSVDGPSQSAAQAIATPVPLANYGTVGVYGKCFTSGGALYADVFASTSSDGALLSSASNVYVGTPYLDTTTPESARVVLTASASNGGVGLGGPPFLGVTTLIGPDGKGLFMKLDLYSKNGDNIFGNGPYGVGQSCIFQVSGEKLTLG